MQCKIPKNSRSWITNESDVGNAIYSLEREFSYELLIGCIVNDVAAVNIDAKLAKAVDKDSDTVELQNGCACCSAAEELFTSIEQLLRMSISKRQRYDHIVIEATGVAEPRQVLRSPYKEDHSKHCLRLLGRLHEAASHLFPCQGGLQRSIEG